jgi:hypothetical protein
VHELVINALIDDHPLCGLFGAFLGGLLTSLLCHFAFPFAGLRRWLHRDHNVAVNSLRKIQRARSGVRELEQHDPVGWTVAGALALWRRSTGGLARDDNDAFSVFHADDTGGR